MKILRSLVAVAWADSKLAEPEQGLLGGLLWAFGADDEQEQELLEYAKKRRTLEDDLEAADLSREERELLLAHAALLTHADGKQTKAEKKILDTLIERLEIPKQDASVIVADAKNRAKSPR